MMILRRAAWTWTVAAFVLGACGTRPPQVTQTAAAPRETTISLTFDDGDADNFGSVAVLRQYGLHATWYIPSGLVGTPGYMSWDQLETLRADGNEIGGHSVHHVGLDTLDSEGLRREVCGSREELAAHGFAAASFAYPFGGYNAEVKQTVRECGFASARTIGAGPEDIPPPDPFALRAYPYIVSDTSFSKLRRYVSDMRNQGGGWMILIFHHVCDGCDNFSVRPDVLSTFIEWLSSEQAQGRLNVGTVGEIVQEGRP